MSAPVTPLVRERVAGDGVVLRPLRDSDLDDVVAACNDAEIHRFLRAMPNPYTADDARHFITVHTPQRWTDGHASFAIADPDTDRLLGTVGLSRVRPTSNRGSVGYWTAPWARRRGVTTRAVRTLAGWAFGHGLIRLELITDPANEGSMRVALGSGFKHEGVRRAGGSQLGLDDAVVWSRLVSDSGDPAPRLLPDLPVDGLTDGVVTLRRLAAGDAAALYALQILPEVLATSVRATPPAPEDAATRCARVPYQWLLGNRAEFAVRDAATDEFAGDIGLYHEALTSSGMIGYSLRREWRGRGYATRAARLVADWAFDSCGIARVVAGTAADNTGSQRVLEKAGFRRESYERSRLPGVNGGPRIDNIGYALLPTDRPQSP